MRSSTSSSEPPAADALAWWERPSPALAWRTAALVALVVAAAITGAWELHWRRLGAVPDYTNSPGLWARERRKVQREPGATVLIGSSRTLSNLQLDVWEELDGRRPIQLAIEGTSPMTVLEGLADDTTVTGRVLVGVAPGLFFNGYEYYRETFAGWDREGPAKRWGQWLSMHTVEPRLAFIEDRFALATVLKNQHWPQRAGAPARPDVPKLFTFGPDRNSRMWSRVITDTAYRNLVRRIWTDRPPAPPPDTAEQRETRERWDRQIARAAAATARLRARGVEVIFVAHPVTAGVLVEHLRDFPRAATWDLLLARTGAPGIHWMDYPELQPDKYEFPEWSHMDGPSADRYTRTLYGLIGEVTAR